MRRSLLPLVYFLLPLTGGGGVGLSSCSEDDISPSANNWLVDFPQGSNTYDTEIKQVYDLYGTQMLYRYNDGIYHNRGTRSGAALCRKRRCCAEIHELHR